MCNNNTSSSYSKITWNCGYKNAIVIYILKLPNQLLLLWQISVKREVSFNVFEIFLIAQSKYILNMICGLSMTHSHTSKITKWPHIPVKPLVGSPKPRNKSKNSPTHPGTEKREAKVVILGDFRGGLRVLFHRIQTWACGYEEI